MSKEIEIGQTDYSTLVFIPDSASTDGSGKTGLVAADLTVSYTRVETDNDVVVTDATGSLNDLAALTTAHTDWGLKEVSNTLAPGLYRLDIADAVFASGAWTAVVYVMVTTSAAAASPIEFILTNTATIQNFVDGVLDEANADHLDAGSIGLAISTGGTASGLVITHSPTSVEIEAGIVAGAGLTNDSATQLEAINMKQAIALILAACNGVLSGAATTTVTIKQAAVPAGVSRVVATVDADGNRSALILKVPD